MVAVVTFLLTRFRVICHYNATVHVMRSGERGICFLCVLTPTRLTFMIAIGKHIWPFCVVFGQKFVSCIVVNTGLCYGGRVSASLRQ